MSATDTDREKARYLLDQANGSAIGAYHAVTRIAEALAAEREAARAPFLQVAAFVDEIAMTAGAKRGAFLDVADRIRRAAEDPR